MKLGLLALTLAYLAPVTLALPAEDPHHALLPPGLHPDPEENYLRPVLRPDLRKRHLHDKPERQPRKDPSPHLPQQHALCTTPRQLRDHLTRIMDRHQHHFGITDVARKELREKVEDTYLEFIMNEGFALKQEPLEAVLGEDEEQEDTMAIPETELRHEGDATEDTTTPADAPSTSFTHRYVCLPAHKVKEHLEAALNMHSKKIPCSEKKRRVLAFKIVRDFAMIVGQGGFIIRESVPTAADYEEEPEIVMMHPGARALPTHTIQHTPQGAVVDPEPQPEPSVDMVATPGKPEVITETEEGMGRHATVEWWHAHPYRTHTSHVVWAAGAMFVSFMMGYFTHKVRARNCNPSHPPAYEPIVDKTQIIQAIEESTGIV